MKLVRSDSPEVASSSASTGALACWGWSALALACIASVLGLLITLAVSLMVSVRAAVWLGGPVFLASNVFLLWRGRSHRLNWVIAGCAERVYVRLFVRRGRGRGDVNEPEVIMLEASEIASMSARTVEVFLYGPNPRIVQWLVIELAQAAAKDVPDHICPLLTPLDPGEQVFVANEEGRLTIEWKWCRPGLPEFLQRVARECPSLVIGHEERSDLDLNGVWRGSFLNLDQQKRQLLVRAIRLGFGGKCTWLLARCKYISFQKAAAYLAEIEREEAGAGDPAVQSGCGCGRRG